MVIVNIEKTTKEEPHTPTQEKEEKQKPEDMKKIIEQEEDELDYPKTSTPNNIRMKLRILEEETEKLKREDMNSTPAPDQLNPSQDEVMKEE